MKATKYISINLSVSKKFICKQEIQLLNLFANPVGNNISECTH